MASRLVTLALSLAVAAPVATAFADTGIGTATAITTTVTGGRDPSESIALRTGDGVFQNEVIITDDNGVGQFEFRDRTKLAIGPNSTLTLDNFVYDSTGSKAKVVINLTQGALRFITGKADHDAYEIVTPAAVIGVRGTVFDVYAKADGELAVAMIDGAVEVCPRGGACRVHNVVGKFLHMTPAGLFSLRDAWDGTFLTGISFAVALPFMNDQRRLIPALRGKTTTIGRYLSAGSVLKKRINLPVTTPLKNLPKPKLPKLGK